MRRGHGFGGGGGGWRGLAGGRGRQNTRDHGLIVVWYGIKKTKNNIIWKQMRKVTLSEGRLPRCEIRLAEWFGALADKPLAVKDSGPACYSRARANATPYFTFILRLSNCLFKSWCFVLIKILKLAFLFISSDFF